MKESQDVKFIGDFESLTRGIFEQSQLLHYLYNKNKFIIVDVNDEIYEISAMVEGIQHFFYVNLKDIAISKKNK